MTALYGLHPRSCIAGRHENNGSRPAKTGKNPPASNLTIVPRVGRVGHSGKLSPLLTFRSRPREPRMLQITRMHERRNRRGKLRLGWYVRNCIVRRAATQKRVVKIPTPSGLRKGKRRVARGRKCACVRKIVLLVARGKDGQED